MIWRWAIFFSFVPLSAANLTGRVTLRDSHAPGAKRNDFSNVIVSATPLHGVPAIHASDKHGVILQKDKTFSPHVLAIAVGSIVDFPNLDPIFHNAFSMYSGQIFDVGLYPPGANRSVRFTREGVVRVFCNIHSAMSAVIVVLATPYFAMTRRDGTFELSGLPPGEYEVKFFHERATEAALAGAARRIVMGENSITLPTVTISEAGYLPIPHKNKYGREYPPDADTGYIRQ